MQFGVGERRTAAKAASSDADGRGAEGARDGLCGERRRARWSTTVHDTGWEQDSEADRTERRGGQGGEAQTEDMIMDIILK